MSDFDKIRSLADSVAHPDAQFILRAVAADLEFEEYGELADKAHAIADVQDVVLARAGHTDVPRRVVN